MTDPNRVASRIKRVDVHDVLAAMVTEEASGGLDAPGYSPAIAGAAGGLAIEGPASATDPSSIAASETGGDQGVSGI